MKCPQETMPQQQAHRRPARVLSIRVLGLVLAAGFGGCIYDRNDLCGPHQVTFIDEHVCICKPMTAWTETGCVPCGENEVPGAKGCVCAEGFGRADPTAACTAVSSSLGATCDDATPCADTANPHCEKGTAPAGYCTKTGCTQSTECEGGYACDTTVSPSLCRRPPLGDGKKCSTSDECAGTEATFCENHTLNACVVEGCSVTENDCFPGKVCCDLSNYGVPKPICLPEGGC